MSIPCPPHPTLPARAALQLSTECLTQLTDAFKNNQADPIGMLGVPFLESCAEVHNNPDMVRRQPRAPASGRLFCRPGALAAEALLALGRPRRPGAGAWRAPALHAARTWGPTKGCRASGIQPAAASRALMVRIHEEWTGRRGSLWTLRCLCAAGRRRPGHRPVPRHRPLARRGALPRALGLSTLHEATAGCCPEERP